MVKDLVYYEKKLDIIIYLLNSTDDDTVSDYLLDEYTKNYIEYERLYNEQEREYKHHLPQWIGYKLFCYNNGLVEGNLRTLEEFIRKYYK